MNLTTTYTNPIFEMIGYEPKTTFWSDFSIADMFGTEGVQDTYNRAKESWQDNIEFMTEFAMVLNHKSWQPLLKTIVPHKKIIKRHKTIIKILYNERRRNTTVQKHDTVTQKDNKHTRKRGKDTPKHSTLTQKNAREQGGKLLKENGSEYFRKRSEKACKRGRAEKKK